MSGIISGPVRTLVAYRRQAVICLMLFFLCGCTTTVKPYSSGSLPPPTNNKISDKDKIGHLPVKDLVAAGKSYLAHGNDSMAELYFSIALAKDSDSIPALFGIGEILRHRGHFETARGKFEQILTRNPGYSPALLALGRISREQGDYNSAIKRLNKALALEPEDPGIITELAITYDDLDQEPQAEPLYREVVKIKPDLASAHNNLGVNLLLQGRYPEAISELSRALNLAPRNKKTQNNLATAFLLNGEAGKALRVFENSVGKAAAYNNVGFLYMSKGLYDKAQKAFEEALAIDPIFYLKAQQNLERLSQLRDSSH